MENPLKIAINGFGRIGRSLMRVLHGNPAIRVAAINDLIEPAALAHFLKYDSVHGAFGAEIKAGPRSLSVDGTGIPLFSASLPETLPWAELGIDCVAECTGKFANEGARAHLAAGARRVIVSAPARSADLTVVMGVNHQLYDAEKHHILSSSSCTANCLCPVLMVLEEEFGVQKGLVTTIHSYTNDQNLLDHPGNDLRRARAAALSIIPTTTGAGMAVGEVLPYLKGKIDGISVRVPTPDVSLADLTVLLRKKTAPDEVNMLLKKAAGGRLKGILHYSEEPLVSSDHLGSPYSAIVDGLQTRIAGRDMVKISVWYDNEWGYANRLTGLMELIRQRQGGSEK